MGSTTDTQSPSTRTIALYLTWLIAGGAFGLGFAQIAARVTGISQGRIAEPKTASPTEETAQ